MTIDELRRNAESHLPAEVHVEGAIGFIILAAILGAVVSWVVTGCLNKIFGADLREPGPIHQAQLRRLVRWKCREACKQAPDPALGIPDVRSQLRLLNLNGSKLFALHGDTIQDALRKTGAGLRDKDVAALRVAYCPLSATGELPEDA